MTRSLTALMLAGALVSVGCAKKQQTESSGSLLSGSASTSDEEEQDSGIRDGNPQPGPTTGTGGPDGRIPR